MTPQEEAQLRRVYNMLCDYGAKRQVKRLLRPKVERYDQLRARLSDEEVAEARVANELQNLSQEIEELKEKITAIEAASEGRVTAADLSETLKALGKRASKKEVEDMIWEVDENLDGCVDWDEMRLMVQRNLRDQSGLEPAKLFNLVQFCLYDQNDNGRVSVDETMNMLYARYGRAKMEHKLKELFGDDMQENGVQGGEIDFNAYLAAVERVQINTFLQSAQGKASVAKAGSVRKLLGKALLDESSTMSNSTQIHHH